jgi:hypothetical protein
VEKGSAQLFVLDENDNPPTILLDGNPSQIKPAKLGNTKGYSLRMG